MLEKTFDPKLVEARLYGRWEASGVFRPEHALSRDPLARPFCMVIPPPNVTGALHIGHALNTTIQDVLARFHRMKGEAVLWLPGTDHAGIATQMVVERQLAAEGDVSRRDLGRDAFVDRVWAWKSQSGGSITHQLRRLGASCDWSRERFTLDEGLSLAVRRVFVELHRQGLIYRDKRLVNWDPHFQTAISDLEVEQKEVDGAFWRFAYPLEDGSGEIVVATTRPETMLGDTAVAVHPEDDRYRDLVGRRVRVPIVDRLVPIVADPYADPEKGSGAVKITPAHDFNDFEVGRRHGLDLINVLDPFGRMNTNSPAEFVGMDRFAVRRAVVARMDELGFLRGVDATRHMVPHGDRSGVVIEPYLTDQWYVDAKVLAGPALAAVERGDTVFEPAHWDKTYFEWMRNIEPWCISRQLWWGHRIPAWYAPDGEAFVAETEAEAEAAAHLKYGRGVALKQDDDVLDTWFSSALWPFSTLGWPRTTQDLARFYPTDTLVTGFDIIFFWVARMMMMGLHFNGAAPFRRVVINGLVRDEHGQKMSKSKGNVIDPLEVIDDFGADALRFTLAMVSGTRDIKLARSRIEGYRNFGTKLWNAARFCQMNECVSDAGFDPAAVTESLNRWIRGELVRTAETVSVALDHARVDNAAQALYRFVWNVFCDWYVELAKPILNGDDELARVETRGMAAWTLDQTLKLLHPVSPFITEELWDKLAEFGTPRGQMLIESSWPILPAAWVDIEADADIEWLIDLVSSIRSIRAEMNVPPSARPVLTLVAAEDVTRGRMTRHRARLCTLARLESVREAHAPPARAVLFVAGEATGALAIAEFIDVKSEKARLTKALASLASDAERVRRKLDNADFVTRAPPAVVADNREKLAEAELGSIKLKAALVRLEMLE